MSAGGSKRAVAEIRFGEDRAGVAKVGGRSIHQYWSMLQPHFRDVFLAPQRRSDDGGVSWTWREPAEQPPLTAAELAGVRGRLERAKESFEENPVNQLMNEARGGGASSQEIIDQLMARVKSLAEGLSAKPDVALAEFVCRTETGVMVHSWGLVAAAKIFYPDSLESGVGGVVLFGGKGSTGNDVVIENAKGLRVARTTTDEAGEFSFTKLAPGRYRVRVISGPGEFSAKGLSVTVERGEMARIEIRSTSDPEVPGREGAEGEGGDGATDTAVPVAEGKRRSRAWLGAVVALVFFGGGLWIWRGFFRADSADSRVTQRISTLTPEDFSSAKPAARAAVRPQAGGGTAGTGLGAAADGVGEANPLIATRAAPSMSAPAPSKPSGTSSSISKIGTRVELSGVKAKGVGTGSTSGATKVEAGTGGDGGASSSTAETQQNVSTESSPSSGQTAGEAKGGNLSSARLATAVSSGAERASGGSAPDALAGHVPSGLGGAMPESPSGSEAERRNSLGDVAGLAKDPAKANSSKVATLPISDRAKEGASPEAAVAASGDGRADSPGPGGLAGAAQGPVAAVSVIEKSSSKSAAPTSTGAGSPPDASENSSDQESSQAEQAEIAEKQGKGPKTPAPPRAASNAESAEGDASSGGDLSAESNSGDATPKSSAPNESSATGNAVNATPAASSTLPSLAPQRAEVPAAAVRSEPLPDGMHFMGVVRLGEWILRVGRDVIVPTLPVREGENDLTEVLRRELLDEQKARLTETLRRPSLQGGVAFKFTAGAKTQALRWSTDEVAGVSAMLKDGRAELRWSLASPPRGGAMKLAYVDGTEVARIEFAPDGRTTVAVRPELRAAFWLGAMYVEAEDARPENTSRYAWQVVRGPLASSAWSFDGRWLDGAGCRLEVVLNGANPAGTRLVLSDQASGWQLATELE